MGISHIGIASYGSDTGGGESTTTCDTDLNVQAGDMLVVALRWYNAVITPSVAEVGGGNSFTMMAQRNNGSSGYKQMGYLLAATADTTATFRVTWNGTAMYGDIIVYQFRPDPGKTVVLDTYDLSAGPIDDANPTTGSMSTTGDDEVVVVATNTNNWGYPGSNPLIAGAAASGLTVEHDVAGQQMLTAYYRIFSSPQASIFGENDIGSHNIWLADIVSFKASVRVIPNYEILKSDNPLIAMRRGGR